MTGCALTDGVKNLKKENDIVILYTANTNCAGDEGATYAGIAAYKKEMMQKYKYVELVDSGNYLSGRLLGTINNGSYAVDIMGCAGYDVATLGPKDFYYSVGRLLGFKGAVSFDIVSCNFYATESDESVFKGYVIREVGDKKIAYVGITSPDTFNLRTKNQFKDENGNFQYSFCQEDEAYFYERVQGSVDAAREEGADYVIVLSNLGISNLNAKYSVYQLISKTSGIDIVIDGGENKVLKQEMVKNKNASQVLLTMPGENLQQFGEIHITDKGITADIVYDYRKKDVETSEFMQGEIYKCKQNAEKTTVKIDFSLVMHGDNSKYLIRKQETNLGDFCADAYRVEMCADIAFVDAAAINSDIKKGELSYAEIESVFPYRQPISLVKASGQQIRDALEMGASRYPMESSAFLQVSGIKFDIDSAKPAALLVEDGVCVQISDEYRVSNITVLNKETGEYEPIDFNKKYYVAISEYMKSATNGKFPMFNDCEVVLDQELTDQQILLKYIQKFYYSSIPDEYRDVNGQGRITIK